jgi:hypothetical protein
VLQVNTAILVLQPSYTPDLDRLCAAARVAAIQQARLQKVSTAENQLCRILKQIVASSSGAVEVQVRNELLIAA